MIQELKLINRDLESDETNQTPFNGSSDIDFDEYGHFVTTTGEQGLEQNLLKAILTTTQPNGYGTEAFSLLGKKNIELIRGKLMFDLLSTFKILKQNQLKFLNQFSTYDKRNIISKVYNILTHKRDKTSMNVSMKVQSLDNELKNKNNLDEINLTITN